MGMVYIENYEGLYKHPHQTINKKRHHLPNTSLPNIVNPNDPTKRDRFQTLSLDHSIYTQECLCSILTRNVYDLMGVAEAIEPGGRALGVSTHVLEIKPVANVEDVVEADALGNTVDSITGGTPD